jgi:ADP-heptose:LPS heptosyltransferase
MHIFDKKTRRNYLYITLMFVEDLFYLVVNFFLKKSISVSRECIVICPAHLGDLVLATPFIQQLVSSKDVEKVYLLTQTTNFILNNYLPSKVVVMSFNHPSYVRGLDKNYYKFFKEIVKLRIFFKNKNISNTFIPYVGYPPVAIYAKLIKNNNICGFTNSGQSTLLDYKVDYNLHKNSHESHLGSFLLEKTRYLKKYGVATEPTLIKNHNPKKIDNSVVIHFGVSDAKRKWADHKWFDLINRLLKLGFTIKIIASTAEEKKFINTNIKLLNGVSIINTENNLLLFEKALAECKFMIGLESFSSHFAAALGYKGIAIFTGIAGVDRMKPLGKINVITKKMTCSPCYSKSCLERHCIMDISVDQVIEVAKKI